MEHEYLVSIRRSRAMERSLALRRCETSCSVGHSQAVAVGLDTHQPEVVEHDLAQRVDEAVDAGRVNHVQLTDTSESTQCAQDLGAALQACPADEVDDVRDVHNIASFDDRVHCFSPALREAGWIIIQPMLVVQELPEGRQMWPRPIDPHSPFVQPPKKSQLYG